MADLLCLVLLWLWQAAGSAKRPASEEVGEPDPHDLAKLAAQTIVQHYSQKCPDKVPLVKRMLSAQGLH